MRLELLNYHLQMLGDSVRIAASKQAISDTVRRGDTVVDIGTGAGVLARLACKAGASRVYAIDESDIIEAAREAVRESEFRDRIVFSVGLPALFNFRRKPTL